MKREFQVSYKKEILRFALLLGEHSNKSTNDVTISNYFCYNLFIIILIGGLYEKGISS